MTPLWTATEAIAAAGGHTTSDWRATGVSIDSRTLEPGDLFVALTDVRDGHDFVARAFEAGAAAALVSRVLEDVPADSPLLIVDAVLPALRRLAAAARRRSDARIIGITGSVGKTSTKEMLRAVLSRQGRVHAAERSFNNHWGVPLTLARLPQDAEYAVIEIGTSHPGEVAPLARLAHLNLALVTTVAPAHLEAFGSIEGIAREKASIFEGLKAGGVALFHGELEVTPVLAAAAARVGARCYDFGHGTNRFCQLVDLQVTAEVTVARARIGDRPVLFKLPVPGRHFALNALMVLGAVDLLDLDLACATQALGNWRPPEGRGTHERLSLDPGDAAVSFELIDDAFNANPVSMVAALEALAAARPVDGIGQGGRGRRIAVLGDMLELGPDEHRLHAELVDCPSIQSIDVVHCVGPRMRTLYDRLPRAMRGRWVETAVELANSVRGLVDAGDVLLVKGSKGSKVSLVGDAVRGLGQPMPGNERQA